MDIGDELTHAPLAATAALEGNLQPVGVPHHGVPPIAYRDPQILGLVAVEIQHVRRRPPRQVAPSHVLDHGRHPEVQFMQAHVSLEHDHCAGGTDA